MGLAAPTSLVLSSSKGNRQSGPSKLPNSAVHKPSPNASNARVGVPSLNQKHARNVHVLRKPETFQLTISLILPCPRSPRKHRFRYPALGADADTRADGSASGYSRITLTNHEFETWTTKVKTWTTNREQGHRSNSSSSIARSCTSHLS